MTTDRFTKREWAIIITGSLVIGILVYFAWFNPDTAEMENKLNKNETEQEVNKAKIEANDAATVKNDADTEKQSENVHNKAKEAHKRISRPIDKPVPVEMEVMYNELLNVKEL